MSGEYLYPLSECYGTQVRNVLRSGKRLKFHWQRVHSNYIRHWMLRERFFNIGQAEPFAALCSTFFLPMPEQIEPNDPDKEMLNYLFGKLKTKVQTTAAELLRDGTIERLEHVGNDGSLFRVVECTTTRKLEHVLGECEMRGKTMEAAVIISNWMREKGIALLI